MSADALPTAASAGYRMPAEWAPHERCWMAWPCRKELWGDNLAATQKAYAGVANAIAEFEPVTMLTPPAAVASAEALCADGVTVMPADLDDSWTRDSGPNFVTRDDGALAASVFHFNAWGNKYRKFRKDAALGHRLAEYLGVPTFSSPIFMEGGGINVDGEGTLLTTEQCVLNPNRNPGLGKQEAEQYFRDALGVEKVLWMPGDPDDQETDGHVDGIACFVKPGLVLVELSPAKGTPRYDNLQKNLQALEGATDATGRELEIVTINEAFEAEKRGDKFALSYINFYIANGGIVMPAFGIERDTEAKEKIESLFPDRKVSQVNVGDVAIGGGGIHCITQQQPAS